MKQKLPSIYLIRHGETEWSRARKHTGRTDIPLTVYGEHQAMQVGKRLEAVSFMAVFTSPFQRATRTAELAGFGPPLAQTDANLSEWDYGDYEGRLTTDIRAERPGWDLFRDGCPNGESLREVSARADRAVLQLQTQEGDVAVFSHAHFLRVLAARWLRLDPSMAKSFLVHPGGIGVLGYEHDTRDEPVIIRWNVECRIDQGKERRSF